MSRGPCGSADAGLESSFARRDMKTDDGYFRGFPALWNIVALYVYVASPAPWLAAASTILLAVLTFAPVHTVHPMRVRDYGAWLPAITMVWGVSTLALLLPPTRFVGTIALPVSLASAVLLVALGSFRSFRPQ